MSGGELVTVFAAAGVLLTALGAVIVNIIMALKQSAAIIENTKVTQEVSAKADVIKGHVNSAASQSKEKIDALEQHITQLIAQLAQSRETAALLAQSAATVAVVLPLAATVELATPPKPKPEALP
jgi:predicted PurR-regulated permease PerM